MVKPGRVRLRTVVAPLVVLLCTFYIVDLIHRAQQERIASVVDTFSRVFTARLEESLQTRLKMAEMLAQEWRNHTITGMADFAEHAAMVQANFEDLQALNWINAEGVITRVIPHEGNAQALGLDVSRLATVSGVFRQAGSANELRLSPPISLAQGGLGFVAYLPVRVDGALAGYINPVFRSAPLVEHAMGSESGETFSVTIRDGDALLYLQPADPAAAPYASIRSLSAHGRTWTIEVAPSRSEIISARSHLDEIIAIVGILIAIGFGLLLQQASRSKEVLVASEERFALAMRGANDGLFDWDIASGQVYYSPRWMAMLGYGPQELPQDYATFLRLVHPEDAGRVQANQDQSFSRDGDFVENEFRMLHKDGHWINILSRSFIVRADEKVVRMVGTHVDITELKRQQCELERVVNTDELTGLLNRRGLGAALDRKLAWLKAPARLAVFHIDMDLFKSVNDRDGHDAGDAVLKEAATRLRAFVRGLDVLARVGGDEFLLVRRTLRDDAENGRLAERIIGTLSRPIEVSGKSFRVGASIGLAFVGPGGAAEMDRALIDANIATSEAKAQGRSRHAVFQPAMRNSVLRDIEMTTEIREGLERGEFIAWFQPQVDLRSNRIVGFESLARWNHPEHGILSAAAFIAHAERAHLVEAIDNQVFAHACRAIAAIEKAGAAGATISVNMSTAQLSDAALVDRLKWTVDEHGVAPERLSIEILETTLLSEGTAQVVQNISRLSSAGFGIELDDFGTGHTAIASLRNFPVTRIKIDRSLVSSIAHDSILQAITSAIIDLGYRLGIEVLAEGVETPAERDFLAATHCTQVQGYLVARPMPLDQLGQWISTWQGGARAALA